MDIYDAMTIIRIAHDCPGDVSLQDLSAARAVLEEKIKSESEEKKKCIW